MGWVYRDRDQHAHDNPEYVDQRPAIGDIWECSCGKEFIVATALADVDCYKITWREATSGDVALARGRAGYRHLYQDPYRG